MLGNCFQQKMDVLQIVDIWGRGLKYIQIEAWFKVATAGPRALFGEAQGHAGTLPQSQVMTDIRSRFAYFASRVFWH